MGRYGMAALATLLGLVASAATATAAPVPMPTDPDFAGNGWSAAIQWTPPPTAGVSPVPIAIVDTGMLPGFADFAGYLDDSSADCAGRTRAQPATSPPVIADHDGHGTRVAELAAAPANGIGSVGVSPNSTAIVVRVTSDSSDYSGVACAFRYLASIAENQPLVVNLSFSANPRGTADPRALEALVRARALVVAAAGNGAKLTWPATAPHVLAAGRVDGAGAHGPALDVTAPGANLKLPQLNGAWRVADAGTSYASPIVAGVAARIWARYEDLENPQQVAWILRATAAGKGRFSTGQGFGLVNLRAALNLAPSAIPRIDEWEPNDVRGNAQKISCRRTCVLRGLVVTTDDPVDWWKLGKRRCPRLRGSGIAVTCKRIRGTAYVKVAARASTQRAYTLKVPR